MPSSSATAPTIFVISTSPSETRSGIGGWVCARAKQPVSRSAAAVVRVFALIACSVVMVFSVGSIRKERGSRNWLPARAPADRNPSRTARGAPWSLFNERAFLVHEAFGAVRTQQRVLLIVPQFLEVAREAAVALRAGYVENSSHEHLSFGWPWATPIGANRGRSGGTPTDLR